MTDQIEKNKAISAVFQNYLSLPSEGQVARDYLLSRGFSIADAKRFSLGYAPGVQVLSEDNETDPKQRDRLMFSIFSASDRLVGFSGRTLRNSNTKFLNSAESETFQKGEVLYGLNWTKNAIRKADRVIIVEGYFDALRLITAGLEEVVAPMGTRMTESQALLLRRYTKNAILLYDGDKAGAKASVRSHALLESMGFSTRAIVLPPEEDPDKYVIKYGIEALYRLIEVGQ